MPPSNSFIGLFQVVGQLVEELFGGRPVRGLLLSRRRTMRSSSLDNA